MTNEEASELLKRFQSGLDPLSEFELMSALSIAIAALQNQQEWIPCSSERLPEEGQIVLATHLGGLDPSRQVIEHIYSGGKFLLNWEMDMETHSPTFGQRYMGEVVAWMPLPPAYRGGKE